MSKPPKEKKKRRWLRRTIAVLALPVFVLGLWIAIHRVRWLGPLLADAGRAIFGPKAIAWLEEKSYGIQDRVNLATRKDEQPQAYWDVPTVTVAPLDPAAPPPTFHPANVPPIIEKFGAPGDGQWVPVVDPRHPDDAPRMYKTLLHPDRKRPWTGVAIVAVDLGSVEVHSVAGRAEPESTEPGASKYERKAIIPTEDLPNLLAAFNGGYKTINGRWGMKVDGVMLSKPHGDGCTFAKYDDGSFAIRPWNAIADTESKMVFARQAPGCLVDQGKLHPALTVEDNTYWGAAIGGETVIRRSAIGLSEDKQILFVSVGDAANAPVIAAAMKHAGSFWVEQLDVNWSFPRFLVYAPRSPGALDLVATPLCKGFEFSEDEYVRERSTRDFFYLTRKVAAASP